MRNVGGRINDASYPGLAIPDSAYDIAYSDIRRLPVGDDRPVDTVRQILSAEIRRNRR